MQCSSRDGRDGSIPARAGEPLRPHYSFDAIKVYPRACGGTDPQMAADEIHSGLSPRVRGNLRKPYRHAHVNGSIPARAGEPQPRQHDRPNGGVYPRACGGTCGKTYQRIGPAGLSPRVRGNRLMISVQYVALRSIPARAGEPLSSLANVTFVPVYPRACGGTTTLRMSQCSRMGLSPRVRGNRQDIHVHASQIRSIPARAGEPEGVRRRQQYLTVYPRACGGTEGTRDENVAVWGLSPRVRGNRSDSTISDVSVGSIPARAGEPRRPLREAFVCTVYPRACGGTSENIRKKDKVEGLSPRVRGNRNRRRRDRGGRRSIPARAGEPICLISVGSMVSVYPRACGGT